MRYQAFGPTGFAVSIVSMGSNRLGDPGVDPAHWPPLVRRALEQGVNFFDTSNSYNQGRSEEVLGDILSPYSGRTYVATKVGFPPITNDGTKGEYSARTILTEVEDSLRRLRRDTIDLYMLHSPTVRQLETDDWATAIDQLKAQGKVHFFGVSTQDHASGIWAIRHGAEFLQVEYHLLDWSAEDALLPLAQKHNVGIIVRMPLARGLLTGKFPAGEPIPADQQWRRPTGDLLQQRLRRVEQLRFLERDGQTLGQAAIRFVLSHPAVHRTIPGARTIPQLEANVVAADGELRAEELARIRALQREWGDG